MLLWRTPWTPARINIEDKSYKMAMDDPSCSCRFLLWFLCFVACVLLESAASVHSWCPLHPSLRQEAKFKQKTNKFWEYQEQSNTWVEISMPFNLMSCINDTCTKVGSIEQPERRHGRASISSQEEKDAEIDDNDQADRNDPVLPIRKRISLTRMSESSVWVTGQSGSIYERFWNGLAWVIAPHELPISVGYATATFIVNTTILALSEAGILYQVTCISICMTELCSYHNCYNTLPWSSLPLYVFLQLLKFCNRTVVLSLPLPSFPQPNSVVLLQYLILHVPKI